jgi:hypothetical protein
MQERESDPANADQAAPETPPAETAAQQIDRLRRAVEETTNDLERTADSLADLLYAARFVCPVLLVNKATDQLNAARDRVEGTRRAAARVPDPAQAPAGAPPEAAEGPG